MVTSLVASIAIAGPPEVVTVQPRIVTALAVVSTIAARIGPSRSTSSMRRSAPEISIPTTCGVSGCDAIRMP